MTLEYLDAEVVIASDIHLTNMESPRGQLLMKLLDCVSNRLEFLVLNGDIFDFCFGKKTYFQKKFARLGESLSQLASRGVQVVFVEGNHEFSLPDLGWKGIEFVGELSKTIQTKSGNKIAITHGDLLLDDPRYQRFRRFIKSKKIIDLAGKLPGRWLDVYALKHAKISRSQDEYRHLDHVKIVEAAFKWLSLTEASTGVFGHFHNPYSEMIATQGSELRVFCVESWDKPNILVMKGGKFFRAYLEDWIATKKWVFMDPLPIVNPKVLSHFSEK